MSNKDDSMLSFSYYLPAMVFAADLLEESPLWPRHRQKVSRQFVREEALPMNTMDRKNNWGMAALRLFSPLISPDAGLRIIVWLQKIKTPISC